jgi:hypothetical protein
VVEFEGIEPVAVPRSGPKPARPHPEPPGNSSSCASCVRRGGPTGGDSIRRARNSPYRASSRGPVP